MRQKTQQVKFRLSDEERDRLDNLIYESGMSLQDYCRRCCLKKKIVVDNVSPELRAIQIELSRVDNNFNQLIKKLNERNYVDYGKLHETLEEVRKAWQSLNALAQEHQ